MTRPAPLTKQEQAEVLAAAKRLEARENEPKVTQEVVLGRLRAGVGGLLNDIPEAMRGAMPGYLEQIARELRGKRG